MRTGPGVAEDLRSLNGSAHSHTWKKELKKAGPGPGELQELRAKVPRRTILIKTHA